MPESGYLPYSFKGKNQKPSYGDFYCVEVFAKFEFLKEFLSRVFWQTLLFFFFQLSPGAVSWILYCTISLPQLFLPSFNLNQSKQYMRICYNISLLLTTSYFFHNPLAGSFTHIREKPMKKSIMGGLVKPLFPY